MLLDVAIGFYGLTLWWDFIEFVGYFIVTLRKQKTKKQRTFEIFYFIGILDFEILSGLLV